MLIIGHELIPYEEHYLVQNSAQIDQTPPNSILFLQEFDIKLMSYLNSNELRYSVVVQNSYELIVANALNAAYIITNSPKKDQAIATNYLFDAKVLTFIENLPQIDELVPTNIDGVIFKTAIKTTY